MKIIYVINMLYASYDALYVHLLGTEGSHASFYIQLCPFTIDL